MSKRLTNPKDLRFIVLRQHMTILGLKKKLAAKEARIQTLEARVECLKGNTWFRRILKRIKEFLAKGRNA